MTNDLGQFIIDNNVLTIIIATSIGFSFSNVIKSFKTNIIDYHIINFFKLQNSNSHIIIFLTSILEFLFILIILYNLYLFVFKKLIDKYKKEIDNNILIQQQIANSLASIDTNIQKLNK